MSTSAFTAPVQLTPLARGAILAAAIAWGCSPGEPGPVATAETAPEGIVGTWRAVLASPGGPLPFTLRIEEDEGSLQAAALTAGEPEPFSSVSVTGREVLLDMEWYDSAIRAQLSPDGSRMEGEWRKTVPAGLSRLPFTAERNDQRRFLPVSDPDGGTAGEPRSFHGDWEVAFTDQDGTEPARGEFRQTGAHVTGTFLTPTGDYRFLEGTVDGNLMRLSTFDGGHAFLFHARMLEDGTLQGDFWSRDTYHATWSAERIDSTASVLPDAWALAGLTNDQGLFRFDFPDLDGQRLTLDDPRFDGKVVLVNIFGSWCPNCNDKAPLLADWHRRYRDRGLEIVGLAYEFTGEVERDREQVRRYAVRHGVEFPLLLAGLSDKKKAAETLPDLSAVIAFPTTVFIGRDGKARRVHTGFTGPGTGGHYDQLVTELESVIEELLAEPA